MESVIQVALDGPAGAGKSSVAKALAKKLNYIYLDTGAMYRAVTYTVLQQNIDLNDEEALKQLLDEMQLEFSEPDANGIQRLLCNGKDVTDIIRSVEVTNNVSAVSMIAAVRQSMMERQREIAKTHSVVMDGRDIGTVVLPNAQYKFFLTASIEERARRRMLEMQQKGMEVKFDILCKEMAERDKKDSERAIAPLRQADDAILIDSTNLSFEEVLEKLFSIIEK